MKSGIKKKLYDEKGSTLSFVLIIGMILMLLVASLLTVANSGLTFTQESVENRQGYIDAKSVIEFGKIEINKRFTELHALDVLVNPTLNQKADRTAKIAALSNTFTVYGTTNSETGNIVIESLSLSSGNYNGVVRQALGVCTVVPTVINATTNKYTFNLKTQNIRRALDYKVDFDYVVTSFNNWTATTEKADTKPTDNEISAWKGTAIYVNGNNVKMRIAGVTNPITDSWGTLSANSDAIKNYSLNIGKLDGSANAGFAWLQGKTLQLSANSVFVSEPLINTSNGIGQNYNSSTTFNMTAKKIIFPGDLKIGDNVSINLTCDNLWVGGNITMGKNSTLKVTGTQGNTKNQMIVGGKISTNRPSGVADLANVNISNLAYFECGGLDIYNNNYLANPVANRDFVLSAKTIVVKGDCLIEGPGWKDTMLNSTSKPIHFTTQYFDCSGKTVIKNFGCPSSAITFSPNANVLNVRFAGGYDQRIAHVDIDNAQSVVFGTSFYLQSNGVDDFSKICWSHLYVMGNSIYLEGNASDSIQMTYNSFLYDDYNNKNNLANLYNQAAIKYLDNSGETVLPGSYTGRTDQKWYWKNENGTQTAYLFGRYIPDDLTRVGEYPMNSTSGTVGTGTEKYY